MTVTCTEKSKEILQQLSTSSSDSPSMLYPVNMLSCQPFPHLSASLRHASFCRSLLATNKTSCLDGDVAYFKSGGDVEREERGETYTQMKKEKEKERTETGRKVGRWWTEKYQDNVDVRICRQQRDQGWQKGHPGPPISSSLFTCSQALCEK